MTTQLLFPGRRMRVCTWNATPGFISAASAALDQQLRQLVQVEMVILKALDESTASPCDLLIISAEGIDEEQFSVWVKSLSTRIPRVHGIPSPALIFATIGATVQRELLRWAVEGNWYFDIVDPDHVTSLPVRAANFLRIHDHLHEVRRMSETTKGLEAKVQDMQAHVEDILKGAKAP